MSVDRSKEYRVIKGPFHFKNEQGKEVRAETDEIISGIHPDSAKYELEHGSIEEWDEDNAYPDEDDSEEVT